MAGANHYQPKPSSHRKSRWESSSATSKNPNPDPKSQNPPKPSTNPKSNPNQNHNNKSKFTGGGSGATSNPHRKPTPPSTQLKPNPSPSHANLKQQLLRPDPGPNHPDSFLFPDLSQMGPPPQPTYGFHMLLRRTIVLADGTVRSYFALPLDYQDFAGPSRPGFDGLGQPGPFRGGLLSPEGAVAHDGYGRGRERQSQDYWNSLGLDSNSDVHGGRLGGNELGLKRKFGDEEREGGGGGKEGEYARQRQQLLQYGNANLRQNQNQNLYHLGGGGERNEGGPSGGGSAFRRDSDEEPRSSKYLKIGPGEFEGKTLNSRQMASGGSSIGGGSQGRVDMEKVNKEFLRYVKMINETVGQRKKYLENGMQGSLRCVPCGRSSKEFPDTHGLIMHAYHSDNTDLLADHMGFHKALCVLMGWSYSKPPDNSKSYQHLSAVEAVANQDDLIMWPPTVIIHNTCTGKNKENRMEGLGNKMMDSRLRELGFTSGKAKSLYGKEGHQGITLVKFPGDRSGLKEAIRLSEFLEKENHGRKGWALVESSSGKDDKNNPSLVKLDEKTKETMRILYGYLGTAADQDKVDFDTRKKVVIKSIRETLE